MPIDPTPAEVERLLELATEEWSRLEQFDAYYRGKHAPPYTPRTATLEFQTLTQRSVTNLLPMVVETLVDRLYVDGFRPDPTQDANTKAWSWWQANQLDARQKPLYEATAVYGYAWMMVTRSDSDAPAMSPKSPRTWFGEMLDPDDDWPHAAIRRRSEHEVVLLDDVAFYTFRRGPQQTSWDLAATEPHGMGVCPLVRYQNSWSIDGHPVGEIERLIPVQDRLNQTVFDLLVAQTFAAAPQKYIAGLVDDDDSLASALAKRIWVLDGEDTKVGQLPGADLSHLVSAIDNTLRVYGIVSQTPPNYLLGEMVNIAAEALVAADAALAMKVEDRQTLHGESHENSFRLAGVAAGDADVAADVMSQVIWRKTDPRSFAATVDGLTKLASPDGLQVPPSELWTMIPGVTQTTAERWKRERESADPMATLLRDLDRQGA